MPKQEAMFIQESDDDLYEMWPTIYLRDSGSDEKVLVHVNARLAPYPSSI
jgi:hypothetical protein